MKKKLKVVVTCAIEYEPVAIDHIGVKQGLDSLSDKIDYLIIDPVVNRGPSIDKWDYVEKQILEYKPDLIIWYMDCALRNKMTKRIADKLECMQVFWEMDYRQLEHCVENSYDHQWAVWGPQIKHLDHIFLSNKGQIDDWSKFFDINVTYLPHGCYCPKKPVYDKQFRYPCVFIGSMIDSGMFRPRKEFITKLANLIDINIMSGADRDGRNVIWENMPKIYHSSDCVLDISHVWDNPGYASGRYFYTSGLGGCVITKRFPDCEELYPEGIKMYFDEPEEAVELIKYYQTHKEEREKVKIKAFEYNKKKHNFKLRFLEIFKTLNIKI